MSNSCVLHHNLWHRAASFTKQYQVTSEVIRTNQQNKGSNAELCPQRQAQEGQISESLWIPTNELSKELCGQLAWLAVTCTYCKICFEEDDVNTVQAGFMFSAFVLNSYNNIFNSFCGVWLVDLYVSSSNKSTDFYFVFYFVLHLFFFFFLPSYLSSFAYFQHLQISLQYIEHFFHLYYFFFPAFVPDCLTLDFSHMFSSHDCVHVIGCVSFRCWIHFSFFLFVLCPRFSTKIATVSHDLA